MDAYCGPTGAEQVTDGSENHGCPFYERFVEALPVWMSMWN